MTMTMNITLVFFIIFLVFAAARVRGIEINLRNISEFFGIFGANEMNA